MALSTQDFNLAFRRIGNYLPRLKPSIVAELQALKSFLAQQGGQPDLQVVEFDALSDSEIVIADAPCKVFAIVLTKATAVATYSKLTDHATTSSDAASEIRIKQVAIDQAILAYPTGLALAAGATMQGNTTASGGTGSAADGAQGFVLLGKA